MLRWHLNAILLHHTQRFFSAARQALQVMPHALLSDESAGKVLTFFGNLLWAKSPYVTDTTEREENMALLGAMLGTFGHDVVPTGNHPIQSAQAALDQLELELMRQWEPLLDRVLQTLPEDALTTMTPTMLNEVVWGKLFPSYDYMMHQGALQQAILKRLTPHQ